MKLIKEYVERIDEELCSARDYAEMALDKKAAGDSALYQKLKQVAQDELNHAMLIHEMAVAKIGDLKKVYTPPVEMEEAWNKSHKEYVEKTAWIKTMLTM